MSVNQTVARRSLTKGAAQARRLLANIHLSEVVTESTTQLTITAQVKAAVAVEDFRLGALVVYTGERFYFTASKFTGRYYVVIERNGAWACSTRDDRAASAMIDKAKAHCSTRRLAKAC